MRFLVFNQLDSTQLECGRQLQLAAGDSPATAPATPRGERWLGGELLPGSACPAIAVCSGQQSQGRAQMAGRQRRSWNSPPGHLYLSVGLQAPHQADLTLACGVVVAKFVHELLGFAPTLKWPNDLLIDGAKLGGILVETMTVHHQNYVMIGVGLNVSSPPPHPDAATLARWLMPAAAEQLEVTELAAELALRLVALLDRPEIVGRSWLELTPSGPAYQLMAGLPMQHPSAGQSCELSFAGIDAQGQLQARACDGQIHTFISSATAPQLPGLAGTPGDAVWSVWMEAGHSRLKARLYPGLAPQAAPSEARAWPIADLVAPAARGGISSSWLQLVEDWVAGRTRSIYLAADVGLTASLRATLQASGWHVVMIPKKTLRLRLGGAVLAQLGFDRICVMEAALAQVYRYGDTRWMMVVSFGTAMSVNFCTVGGDYLGGALLPGATLARRALTGGIAALAHLGTADQPATHGIDAPFIGMYTAPAITAGIAAQVVGAITYLYEQGLERFGGAGRQPYPQVFVSGGGAEVYLARLRQQLAAAYAAGADQASAAATMVVTHCGVMDGLRILAVAREGQVNALDS